MSDLNSIKDSHGGKRKGAGRKAGSVTRKTREIAEKAHESGLTPLDVMLGTMRALWQEAESGTITVSEDGKKITTPMEYRLLAVEVAQKAAPYVHARLANVQAAITGADGGPLVTRVELVDLDDDSAG